MMLRDKIYFSDDIAILPGNGQVISVGDPRTFWNDGNRPLFIRREELHPDPVLRTNLLAKLKKFVAEIKADKVFFQRHIDITYNAIVDSKQSPEIYEYLCEKTLLPPPYFSDEKSLDDYLRQLFQKQRNNLTVKGLLNSILASYEKIPRVSEVSKQVIFSTLEKLAQKPYVNTMMEYFANRKDFVVLVHPDLSLIPALKPHMAGSASYRWDAIAIAGSSKFDMHTIYKNTPSFTVDKFQVPGPINYGGYGVYTASFNEGTKHWDFILDVKNPINQHGSRLTESLFIEEFSDLMNGILSGKNSLGEPLPNHLKGPTNTRWLTENEEKKLEIILQQLTTKVLSIEKLIEQVKSQEVLNTEDQALWELWKTKLIAHEKTIAMQPRHIITEIDLTIFPQLATITAGDQLTSAPHSPWQAEILEVKKVQKNTETWLTLHLQAPALSKEHQAHVYYLEEMIFQIKNALSPKEYNEFIKMRECIGRLRGLLATYPLAEELLIDVHPFLNIIDQSVKIAITSQQIDNNPDLKVSGTATPELVKEEFHILPQVNYQPVLQTINNNSTPYPLVRVEDPTNINSHSPDQLGSYDLLAAKTFKQGWAQPYYWINSQFDNLLKYLLNSTVKMVEECPSYFPPNDVTSTRNRGRFGASYNQCSVSDHYASFFHQPATNQCSAELLTHGATPLALGK